MLETGPFTYKSDIHGAYVVADQERLHPACKADGEVDFHVSQLKEYLDQVAAQMKKAIKDDQDKPILS